MERSWVSIDELVKWIQLNLHAEVVSAFGMEASEDDLISIDVRESIKGNRFEDQGLSSVAWARWVPVWEEAELVLNRYELELWDDFAEELHQLSAMGYSHGDKTCYPSLLVVVFELFSS